MWELTAGRIRGFIKKSQSLLKRIAVLSLLPIFFIPLYSEATETVVMRVFLNTEDKGEYIFLLTPEGVVLFETEALINMGFKDPSEWVLSVGEKEYVPLNSLPNISLKIDMEEVALHITAEPKLLKRHLIDLSYKRPYQVVHTEKNTAFLNYSLNYSMDDDLRFTSLSLPLEVGIGVGGILGLSSFSYTKGDQEDRFVRLLSSLTLDDKKRLRRYVIGDFSAISGELGGSGLFGGLSISKNFSMMPFFVRYPCLKVSGSVETPSEVEVYIDGLPIKRERLPPGDFELLGLPFATGAGDATIVIKDAFGREKRIVTPFYISTNLLKPGIHEYSYNLGFKREEFGKEGFEYGDMAFVGFHRVGLTEAFTAGFRAEGDKDIVNLGPSATFRIHNAGEIDTSLALSLADRSGYAGSLSYLYTGKGLSGRFSVRGSSKDYSDLSSSQDKPRLEWLIGLGYNQKILGSISATFSSIDRFTGTDMKRSSLNYSRRLFKDISLFVRASRTKTDEVVDEFFVGINFILGKGRSGSLNYRMQDGISTETAYIQKNPPPGTGTGYRLSVERREDSQEEIWGNAFLQYHSPYGLYSFDYRRIAEQNIYNLSASGGVAFINRSVYLTRPITDSFALVKVGRIEDARVYLNNQEVGKTNKAGEVLVPGLISYYDNNLSVEDKDIPVNYEIEETRKYISTPYRGGGIVMFNVRKLQGFVGRAFFVKKGEKRPAEYWGLEIQIEDRKIESIIGKDGEFYLENLPAGKFPARLFMNDRQCNFYITIPESDEIMVYLEEVSCEMD